MVFQTSESQSSVKASRYVQANKKLYEAFDMSRLCRSFTSKTFTVSQGRQGLHSKSKRCKSSMARLGFVKILQFVKTELKLDCSSEKCKIFTVSQIKVRGSWYIKAVLELHDK